MPPVWWAALGFLDDLQRGATNLSSSINQSVHGSQQRWQADAYFYDLGVLLYQERRRSEDITAEIERVMAGLQEHESSDSVMSFALRTSRGPTAAPSRRHPAAATRSAVPPPPPPGSVRRRPRGPCRLPRVRCRRLPGVVPPPPVRARPAVRSRPSRTTGRPGAAAPGPCPKPRPGPF